MTLPKLTPRLLGYLMALLLALGLMYYLRPSAGTSQAGEEAIVQRDWPEIQREGVLRILSAYTDGAVEIKDGLRTGAIYELARQLTARSGLRVEVVLENDWPRALEALRRGEVDLIARPLAHTSEVDTLSFRPWRAHSAAPLYLVQRRDSAQLIRQQLALGGKTIVLPEGSPYTLFVQHLSEEIGEPIHLSYDSLYPSEQLAMRVAAGSIDYTLATGREAERYRKILPELDCSLPLSYTIREAWLLRRDAPQLADSLSRWLP